MALAPAPHPRALLSALREDLRAVGDPRTALGMQQYMRTTMPFHGVPSPKTIQVCRARFGGWVFPTERAWWRTTRFLWRHARFREEWYAIIVLAGSPAAREFQTPAALPLYAEMIRSGAWWDTVDEIAVRRIGPILRRFPRPVSALMRAWSVDQDLWIRRSSIICQVGSGEATDWDLLSDCVRPSIDRREFFLRKAIGWALRQYARTEPSLVADLVAQYEDRLSPLSRREALRVIRL